MVLALLDHSFGVMLQIPKVRVMKWLDMVGFEGSRLHLIECTNCRSVTARYCTLAIDRLVILKGLSLSGRHSSPLSPR